MFPAFRPGRLIRPVFLLCRFKALKNFFWQAYLRSRLVAGCPNSDHFNVVLAHSQVDSGHSIHHIYRDLVL